MNGPLFALFTTLAIGAGMVAFAYYTQRGCDPAKAGYISNNNQVRYVHSSRKKMLRTKKYVPMTPIVQELINLTWTDQNMHWDWEIQQVGIYFNSVQVAIKMALDFIDFIYWQHNKLNICTKSNSCLHGNHDVICDMVPFLCVFKQILLNKS